MNLFAPNAPCDRRSAGGRAWAHAWQALRTPIGSYREPPVVAPAGYGSFPTAVAGLGATEVLVSASRLSLLRAHGGSPLVGMVIAAGAVSGGHLIPVICTPACSMRSISGFADRTRSTVHRGSCSARAEFRPRESSDLEPYRINWSRADHDSPPMTLTNARRPTLRARPNSTITGVR